MAFCPSGFKDKMPSEAELRPCPIHQDQIRMATMDILKMINLALRFLLELCALAALAY